MNGATVDRDDAAYVVGGAVGKFDHDVGSPRLTHHDGPFESDRVNEEMQIVGDGAHVESVVGFGAASVSTLVDRDDGMAEFHQLLGNAVPQPGVRRKAVHENHRRGREPSMIAPRDAVQIETVTNAVELAARGRCGLHVDMSFARHGVNGTMVIVLSDRGIRHDALDSTLQHLRSIVVAFSGGADSAFLAAYATLRLGRDNVSCVTAVSASLAAAELADCRALADEWGLDWATVETNETDRPDYVANAGDRCFHCKDELMDALVPIAAERGAAIVLGVNVDDLGDHRPGQQAAAAKGASFPMVDAGLTKADVRELSKAMGLRTWDKPAAACLSSRVPYGTPVTVSLLGRIERAEAEIRRILAGSAANLRVRHEGDTARIEVDAETMAIVVERHGEIVRALEGIGYRYVTLDLAGFRSGNLNWALDIR